MKLTLAPLLLVLLPPLGIGWGCGAVNDADLRCGDFVACGGELDGTWVVEETCFEKDFTAAENANLDWPAECGDTVTSVEVEVSGTVTFSNGTETGELTTMTTRRYFYSADCIAAMGSEASSAECASLALGVDSGECEYAEGGCECRIAKETSRNLAETFSVSGGTIVFSDGDSSTDFCVEGDTLTLSDGADAELPGSAVLHRVD